MRSLCWSPTIEYAEMFPHHSLNPGLPLQSSMSASWPVSGNDLRRGAGESVEFPTKVKEVVAMFNI
jgi:hypothetical protein